MQYYLEYRSEIDAWIEQNNKAAIEAHLIWAKVNEDLN